MGPPDHQRESPDFVQEVRASGGIDALPARAIRYAKAKGTALDVAEYIGGLPEADPLLVSRMRSCGDYLLFRHYFTVDQVKLHAASFCMKHLLCPLCAIRRGARALKSYLDRWEVIRAEKTALRPFLVTLTVKDGPDLAERFRHLQKAQRELWKRKQRGRGSVFDGVAGAVWSYEVKRGSGSGVWHPHLHMIALAEKQPDQAELRAEWQAITGDSFMCDVRPISQADPVSGFLEVFKYAVKFSDQEPADTWHAFSVLKGKNLLAAAGCFRGVEVPESLTDEALDDLPFVELFYRYLGRAGYSLTKRGPGR